MGYLFQEPSSQEMMIAGLNFCLIMFNDLDPALAHRMSSARSLRVTDWERLSLLLPVFTVFLFTSEVRDSEKEFYRRLKHSKSYYKLRGLVEPRLLLVLALWLPQARTSRYSCSVTLGPLLDSQATVRNKLKIVFIAG